MCIFAFNVYLYAFDLRDVLNKNFNQMDDTMKEN